MKCKKCMWLYLHAAVMSALLAGCAWFRSKNVIEINVHSDEQWTATVNNRKGTYTWEDWTGFGDAVKRARSENLFADISFSAPGNSSHLTFFRIGSILVDNGWFVYSFKSGTKNIKVDSNPLSLISYGMAETAPQEALVIFIAPDHLYYQKYTKDEFLEVPFFRPVNAEDYVEGGVKGIMTTEYTLSQLQDIIGAIDNWAFVQIFSDSKASHAELLSVLEVCHSQPLVKEIFLSPIIFGD